MEDLEQAPTSIELRTGDRTGCLPGCSFDSVCKTWLQQTVQTLPAARLLRGVSGLSGSRACGRAKSKIS